MFTSLCTKEFLMCLLLLRSETAILSQSDKNCSQTIYHLAASIVVPLSLIAGYNLYRYHTEQWKIDRSQALHAQGVNDEKLDTTFNTLTPKGRNNQTFAEQWKHAKKEGDNADLARWNRENLRKFPFYKTSGIIAHLSVNENGRDIIDNREYRFPFFRSFFPGI